jgi:hypothetical protein
MEPDTPDPQELARLVVEAHDRSHQLRVITARSAPLVHVTIQLVRAERLFWLAGHLAVASTVLLVTASGLLQGAGVGGLTAAGLHLCSWLLLRGKRRRILDRNR